MIRIDDFDTGRSVELIEQELDVVADRIFKTYPIYGMKYTYEPIERNKYLRFSLSFEVRNVEGLRGVETIFSYNDLIRFNYNVMDNIFMVISNEIKSYLKCIGTI